MRQRSGRVGARGFSLFEFVVVIVIVAVLAGFVLARMLPLIGRAERAAYLQTLQQVQSALLLEAAERVVRGESATLAALSGSNPMELLLKPPGNYLGVYPDLSEPIRGRSWYFDRNAGVLIYRPGSGARFEALEGPRDRIELHVNFIYRDRDSDGQFDAAVDHFDGLRLDSTYAYAWPD